MYTQFCKMLVIGDNGTGKSSLILRYADNTYTESFIAHLGVEFKTKTQHIEGNIVQNQIWDNPRGHLRGAHAVIITFDLTSPESFGNLQKWIQQAQHDCREDVIIAIAATKCDLTSEIKVTEEDIREYISQLDIPYILVSSLTGEGVEKLFDLVDRKFLSQYHDITLTDSNKPVPVKGAWRQSDSKVAWHQSDSYKRSAQNSKKSGIVQLT